MDVAASRDSYRDSGESVEEYSNDPTDGKTWPDQWTFNTLDLAIVADIIAPEVAKLEREIEISATGECQFCQKVFDQWALQYDKDRDESTGVSLTFEHHSSLLSCKAAANRGCRMCRMLLHDHKIDFGSYGNPRKGTLDLQQTCKFLWIAQQPLALSFNVFRDTASSSARRIWYVGFQDIKLDKRPFWLDTEPQTLSVQFKINLLLWINDYTINSPSAVDSQINISADAGTYHTKINDKLHLAKLWLTHCLKEHEVCRDLQSKRNPNLPSRLLALENGTISLCVTAHLNRDTQYATLSHCWGPLEFTTLTRENMTKYQQEIPLDALCKTFQEAIFIARALDLTYLWIDSLCIIQDDPNDWEIEAPKMCDVYGNSTLTIAAAGSQNGHEGCFMDKTCPSIGHKITRQFNGKTKICECTYFGLFKDCVTETPLATRGWVVQEQILSPRTLYFSSHQMFWECNDRNACEQIPNGFSHRLREMFPHSRALPKNQPIREIWPSIMMFYSKCRLSFPRDKLVAISGVAEKAHASNHDQYLAGLWKEDLVSQLLWSLDDDPTSHKPEKYRAPSWSWASVDGTVSPLGGVGVQENNKVYVQILEAETVPVGLSPFGEISGGFLKLKCDMMIQFENTHGFKDYWIHLDFPQLNLNLTIGKRLDYLGLELGTLYILPILGDFLDDGSYARLHGLILTRTGKSKGRYERVGSCYPFLREDSEDMTEAKDYREMLEKLRDLTILQEDEYVEIHQNDIGKKHSYIIDII